MGEGLERPFDIDFGPDGAMYISDFGVAKVSLDRIRAEQPPYEFPPATGAVWKITPAGGGMVGMPRTGDSFGLLLALLVGALGLSLVGAGWRLQRREVPIK